MSGQRPLDLAKCAELRVPGSFPPERVTDLKAGLLVMSPHPGWNLPATIDWTADPFGDTNWRFQFNMLRWLDPLWDAGSRGDLEALELWAATAKHWVDCNPTDSPQSPEAWMDMADGLRALRLISAAPIVAEHLPSEMGWLTEAIYTHRDWLADDNNWGHANHLLHQLQGLVAAGAVTGSADHVELARIAMTALLRESWDEEGVNDEGAIGYHRANYTWWNEALDRFEVAGVSRPDEAKRLDLAPIELAHATRPDGTFVPIGDTDTDFAKGVDHPACRWVMTGGSEGEPPEDVVRVYKDGYVYARSGWGQFERDMSEETFFALPFGRRKVHGHQDGGALNFSANGVNWVVDLGKFSYSHRTPMRRHMMAHTSHSVPYVVGKWRQREAAVALTRHSIEGDAYDFLFEDYGFAPIRVLRRVAYSTSGEYLAVVDTVRSTKDLEFAQRWQLGPNVVSRVERQTVRLSKDGAHAGLFFFGRRSEIDVRTNKEGDVEGLVSLGWKRSAKAPAVVATKSGRRERFITFLVPGHGAPPEVTRVMDLPPHVLAFRVRTRRTTEVMVLTPDSVKVLPGEPTAGAILDSLSEAGEGAREGSPLDLRWRASVAQAISTARDAAWDTGDDGRARLAQGLKAQLGALRGEGAVLGLEAALADLHKAPSPGVGSPERPGLINWDGASSWIPEGLDLPVVSHRKQVREPDVSRSAIHSVDLGELVLPLAFVRGTDSFLTVDFHGALDRVRMNLPVFQGRRREREQHDGHVLFVADPTLDLVRSLRLGWFLGSRQVDLAPRIAAAVRSFADALGVREVVLRGSSGGGFAALQVGAHLPDATVVAFNPQTDVRNYSRNFASAAFVAAFGCASADDLDEELVKRVSVSRRIEALGQCPTIHYINNSQDKAHLERHLKPFREALEQLGFGDRFHPQLHDFGPGHRRPSPEQDATVMGDIYRSLGFSTKVGG